MNNKVDKIKNKIYWLLDDLNNVCLNELMIQSNDCLPIVSRRFYIKEDSNAVKKTISIMFKQTDYTLPEGCSELLIFRRTFDITKDEYEEYSRYNQIYFDLFSHCLMAQKALGMKDSHGMNYDVFPISELIKKGLPNGYRTN